MPPALEWSLNPWTTREGPFKCNFSDLGVAERFHLNTLGCLIDLANFPPTSPIFEGRRVRVLIEDLSLVWRPSASASSAIGQPWSSPPRHSSGQALGIFLTHLGGAGAGWEQASLLSIYGKAEQGPWEAFLLLKISSARSLFFFFLIN